MRNLLLAILLAVAASAEAQGDSSLTREFGKMSAKERARIARQEVEDAAKDPRYQTAMAEAEGLFREQRYDDALARFQEARSLRPLNVYPKVKIQDLQALIAKREAARTAALAEAQAVGSVQPELEAQDTLTLAKERDPVVVAVEPVPPVETAPERKRVLLAEVKPSPEVGKEPLPAEGMYERTFTEGRAIVLERKLVRAGRMEVYRKVTHPWGEIVYFRDGTSISERHWAEVFP
ncbi:MAG: hypothetical protein IPL52_01255 [Flavobacteriales bacterium]|nr:hypothetical protein [Flavobacteriales bacterium]